MANISKEARVDRTQKEENEIILRSNGAYLEIELFKDYEFTQCIAFEMARRNIQLREAIIRLTSFYTRHKNRVIFKPKNREFFNEAYGYRLHRRAQEAFFNWFKYIEQKFWLKPIDLYYIVPNNTTLEMAEVYLYQFSKTEEDKPSKRLILETKEEIHFETLVELNNEHFFQNKGFVNNTELLVAIQEFNIDVSDIESKTNVTENFSRPKLSIPAVVNKSVHTELNLALPKSELLAYIDKIKQRYEEDTNIIKSPTELLGAELIDIGFLESDTEQIYKKDRRKTLSEKFADLFFIYDCYSNNLSMNYTIDQLNRYWNDERNAFPEQFQQKTYKRYLKLAKDFIENRKYQSLLIGQ